MKSVEGMLNEIVAEENEHREEECRQQVRHLVRQILKEESNLKSGTTRLLELKAELKKLQQPEEVKVSL